MTVITYKEAIGNLAHLWGITNQYLCTLIVLSKPSNMFNGFRIYGPAKQNNQIENINGTQ
jgi:hypothetical protein